MADTKVSALTEDTAPGSDSLVYTVDAPGGTPASRRVTLANLYKGLVAALSSIGGLTPAANKLAYYTSSSAAALTDLSAFGRTLIDDADAEAARATLGVDGEVTFAASRIIGSESGDSAYKGMTAAQAMGVLSGANLNMADATLQRPLIQDPSWERATPSSATNTLTLDYTTGPVFDVTLTENVTTFSVTGWPATGNWGQVVLVIRQGSPSPFTFAWPAGYIWEGGTAPTVTATAGAIDVFVLNTPDAGTTTLGNTIGQAYS